MISHEHKCIFIHIPKTAGSSIKECLFKGIDFDWKIANYEYLYGWCPKRLIHLQHATSKELLETNLVTQEQWNTYYKFTFVRNPWDRAYSDYLWIMKDCGIKDSFKNFLLRRGKFKEILKNNKVKEYRGDHLLLQTDFFENDGGFSVDFVGRFENFESDFDKVKSHLNIKDDKIYLEKKNTDRHNHYSLFYTSSKEKLVRTLYDKDISELNYKFEDKRKGIFKLKSFL